MACKCFTFFYGAGKGGIGNQWNIEKGNRRKCEKVDIFQDVDLNFKPSQTVIKSEIISKW